MFGQQISPCPPPFPHSTQRLPHCRPQRPKLEHICEFSISKMHVFVAEDDQRVASTSSRLLTESVDRLLLSSVHGTGVVHLRSDGWRVEGGVGFFACF